MDVNGYCRESNGFLLVEAGWFGHTDVAYRSLTNWGVYFALRTNVSGADGDVAEPELRHPNGYCAAGAHSG